MAHQAVVDAIEAYLAANWNRCAVVGPNVEGETPQDGSPFLVLQFPVSNTERLSVSTRYYQEEGAVRMVLNMARGEGTQRPLQWAGELADLFRDQAFGGIKFQVPTSPFFDDSNEEGVYFVTTVVAPYTYDFIG